MNPRNARNTQSGYALLIALFLILAMLAAASVALVNGRTRYQRDREELMIWRGEQYKRAIRLYFHKTGHYPQTMEDLQKGLPDLHFLRQAYKDPMNAADGAWRFIYVNPAGQIIGSVKYANLQQMAILDQPGGPQATPGLGTPASALAGNQSSQSSVVAFSQITGTTSTTGQSGTPGGTGTATGDTSSQNPQQNPQNPNPQNPPNPQQGGFGQNPTGPGTGFSLSSGPGQQGSMFGTFGQSSGPGATGNPLADMKPTGPVDGPVLGAFLTGVASKVDKKSVKIFKGGKKYNEWEFIWNPLEDQVAAAQQALGQGSGVPGATLPFANPGIFGNALQNGPGGANPGGQQPQPQPTQPQPTQPQSPTSPP